MERGLAGGASSLKMIPAYLDAQAPPSDGGPVIAIDMGGTNLRIALIEWKNSRMHFLDRRQYPMPGTQGNLERSEFFEQIAEYLLPIADQSARIGLCFSFPCEILPTDVYKRQQLHTVSMDARSNKPFSRSIADSRLCVSGSI